MPGPRNPAELATRIQAALAGVKKTMAPATTLYIGGVAMNSSAIEAQLAGYQPSFAAVAQAVAQYKQALAGREKIEPEAREFLVNLRAALMAFHKRGNPILHQFGMGTGAPGKQSPETMVLAAAARSLTRKKRGTLGKKQKAAIQVVGKPVVTVGGAKSIGLGVKSATPPAVEAALAEAQAGTTKPEAPATPKPEK